MRKYQIGNVYPTNCGVDAMIVENSGLGKQLVKVRWLDEFGYELVVHTSNLLLGKIYNPYAKLMQGLGYVGVGDYDVSVNGVRTLEYETWKGVFHRAYSEKYSKGKPTYDTCEVNPEWYCFQDFGKWINTQIGWKLPDWQIDKDLLVKGNKEYGTETCVLLPRRLNMLIVNRVGGRGDLPIGVHWDTEREKYVGQFRDASGNRGGMKRFENPDEAFIYYKTNRERVIKEVAETYKDQIDPRAYQALMSWEISIYD